ncbi:MAG: efflux RND transporter permease subunit [Myxococcota bacterium]|nr:efflux RND transporter permease subunit [Myxococcota bacterium]
MKDLMKGPIAWMAQNPVASNLLMMVLLLGGLIGLLRIKAEVFPAFELDMVTVSVAYPGASPEEVEQGIVLVVEEEVRGLDGVKRVNATAAEGIGAVTIELLIDADPDRVLADVKTAVDGITSFPEDAEKSQVSLVSVAPQVITMIISGDVSRATLHSLAEKARADLLSDPEITQVTTSGLPSLEIAIEISRETLESYGMTLDEVATQIRLASLDLPGGGIDTEGGEILVRVADRARSGREFGDIVLRSTATGARVRLADIATITDGFSETDQAAFFNGKPAVQVIAYRVGDETPTSVATAVKDYAAVFAPTLPDTVAVDLWNDDSQMLEGRIALLLDNARVGILLVVAILALFLDIRLAFWVSLGIPICFLGAFLILPSAGVSVNMVSLFAFIITLGLVVDDAIVVGENTFARREQGLSWSESAVAGSREMSVPVTFAILTTVAAFAPLTMVPGFMGKIFGIIPTVVVVILMLSLIESFFVLPAHLAHTSSRPPGAIRRFFDRPRLWVTGKLEIFNRTRYQPLLEAVLRQRYISLSIAGALFIISVGMVASGTVPFSFFPKLEGNNVQVNARLTYGAPIEQTDMVRQEVESALARAIERMPEGMVIGQYTTVGETLAGGGPGGGSVTSGSHLMSVSVELTPSEERELSSADFGAAWSAELPVLPGVEALSVVSSSGPGAGAAVDVQLSHSDIDMLAAASAEIASTLRSYDTLKDVVNEYSAGKEQLDFSVNDQGRNLGLTGNDIARQIRGAFFGAEALREQRGRNEIKVMVRLPHEQRRSEYDIEQLKVRTPAGGFVPLDYVADLSRGQAPTTINREEGRRIVNISAELAPGVVSSQKTVTGLREGIFPALLKKYPGLGVELVGEQREQQESLSSLGSNYFFALFAIYALLAIPFKSYTQPLVIMSAIPFGFIGAIAGHLIMGFELSIISMMGIVALTGVVVNDSLVLIDAANRARAEGQSAWDAIIHGGTRRLRPILLTSMTTFLGLAPMILETSVQARFLIPMAISLGFGVLFATVIILLLVPALYLVLEDATLLVARLRGGNLARHEVVAQPAK